MSEQEPRPELWPEPAPPAPSLEPERPPAASAPEQAPVVGAAHGGAVPTLPLPEESGAGISRWEKDRRVTALWSVEEGRSAWVGIGGVGWRRLDGGDETALVALTMLAAHAREQGARVSYREQDGVIRELYVW